MTLLETTADSYRLDVGTYPRVTSVLSLVRPDLREIPADVLAHAAQLGQAVHRACWILAAEPSGLKRDTLHPECVPYVEAFEAFRKALRPVFLEAERLVVSTRYGYAGRLDFLVAVNGKVGVLDVKTGVPHGTHALQTSGYLEGYREETRTRQALKRYVLYLHNTGSYRLVDCDLLSSHAADFKVFCAALQLWRWSQDHANGHS